MIETSAVKYNGRRPASWRAAIINKHMKETKCALQFYSCLSITGIGNLRNVKVRISNLRNPYVKWTCEMQYRKRKLCEQTANEDSHMKQLRRKKRKNSNCMFFLFFLLFNKAYTGQTTVIELLCSMKKLTSSSLYTNFANKLGLACSNHE